MLVTDSLLQFVADGRLEILPNCSHWVHEDARDEVNVLVREFLCTKPADNEEKKD